MKNQPDRRQIFLAALLAVAAGGAAVAVTSNTENTTAPATTGSAASGTSEATATATPAPTKTPREATSNTTPDAAKAPKADASATPATTGSSNATTSGSNSTLQKVVVYGRAEDLLGVASTASEGAIGATDLQDRPFLRRGELLETVPGLVVTQHSGDGKANQYFLRGFDLDHGTDIAIDVDEVPVNFPTHGHGQGYSDLNFMIPELVEQLDYQKGPFYPQVGDFSGAGATDFRLFRTLPQGIFNVGIGTDGYTRELLADNLQVGPGNLIFAFEYNHYDGPWTTPENSNRYDNVLRYSVDNGDDHFTITNTYYQAGWNASNQTPVDLIDNGTVARFGTMNPTDGGETNEDRFVIDWKRDEADGGNLHWNAYATYYRLNLWNDFDYYLTNPVNGDQFEQIDRRVVLGTDLTREWDNQWWGYDVKNTVGVQVRDDYIPHVGFDDTEDRNFLDQVVNDRVNEFSIGSFVQNQVQWNDWLKTDAGLRYDLYNMDVTSTLDSLNSGSTLAGIASPKLGVVLGPWDKTEFYFNLGTGFHSNDARGVEQTYTELPGGGPGDPIGKSSPLVRTYGAETGVRTQYVPGLVTTLSLWILKSDSEEIFDGDTGGTDPAGPTMRYGVEWANFYKPTSWLTLDADFSYSHANFEGSYVQEVGSFVPNSIATVFSAGATADFGHGFYGALRLRYLGPQPLVETGYAWAQSNTIVNARLGYRFNDHYEVALDLLNALDAKTEDIEYYYEYQVSPTAKPEYGTVMHAGEPLEARFSFTYKW